MRRDGGRQGVAEGRARVLQARPVGLRYREGDPDADLVLPTFREPHARVPRPGSSPMASRTRSSVGRATARARSAPSSRTSSSVAGDSR